MGKELKSIVQQNTDECFFCQTTNNLEWHHVFMGAKNRQQSTEMRAVVRLCAYCHRIGPTSVHKNREISLKLMKVTQEVYELMYSHEEFMAKIGKNYLD